jgi:hypothetical protein
LRPPEYPSVLNGEVWGITTCFNPAGYKNKIDHVRKFATGARRQGLKLLIVEAQFRNKDFVVPDDLADIVVHVQAQDILWLKERLINLGVRNLPARCDKVVWLDADVLFEDPVWVEKTAALLNRFIVVQPFSRAFLLEPGFDFPLPYSSGDPKPRGVQGMAGGTAFEEAYSARSNQVRGHPGFAWAIRREALQKTDLYDRFICGGADSVVASAMYGVLPQDLLDNICAPRQRGHVLDWMQSFYAQVRGSVGWVEGNLFHLWHGSFKNRNYLMRHQEVLAADYDPLEDIALDDGGCWRWATNKPLLHSAVARYFIERKEEG